MDQMNWLIWLVVGIALGWLLELLVDYLFWNRRYGNVEAEAKAEVAAARQKLTSLQSELDKAANAQKSLQSQLDETSATARRFHDNVGLVAAAVGTVGVLGHSLAAGDADAVKRTIVELDTQLAAGASTGPAVDRLRGDVDVLEDELAMAAAERVALQDATALLQANADRASHNAGLVAAAGGLVGSLGRALEEGDAAEIDKQVDALSAELNDKANALWEAFTARTTVEGLEKQLAQARAAQAVLQRQADTAVAAQRAAPVPSPSPVAPPAPAKAPVEPATNGDDDAGLAHLSALALLLSGKEPPALDADRLQALIGDVETTRNVRGQDLLQMIDGIDADMEARLDAAGMPTYQRLARATPKTIAAAASVDAETAERWIQQAGAIVSGARPGRNRLTVLRGLEPAMQAKLYDAGIDTYAAVADGDEAQLCTSAGLSASHKADAAIWIFQAKLLAAAPNYRIPQPAAQRPVEEISS